jgi:hypothetical protein
MADREFYEFPNRQDLVDFLNTALYGTVNLVDGATVDNLTFIVDIGGGNVTVTFAPVKSRDWTLLEIIDQINTDLSATVASIKLIGAGQVPRPDDTIVDRRLKMTYGTLTVRSTGTANTALGYSDASDTVGGSLATSVVEELDYHHHEKDTWNLVLYR